METNIDNNNIHAVEKSKSKFDLENGKTFGNFWRIWVPTILTQLISGTFIVFDTIFIAHGYHPGHIGSIWNWSSTTEAAQYAAIGPSGTAFAMPYSLFMISVGLLIGGGISAKIIREKAAGNDKEAKKTLNSLTPIVLMYGLVITFVLFAGAKAFIWVGSGFQSGFANNWYNNPLFNSDWNGQIVNGQINEDAMGQLFQQASWYLRIQALGSIPYIYMISSQITLRVEGKSNVGIKYTGFSLFLNIILDFLLIIVFGLNLVGAAIATIVAQSIAASFYYRYYRRSFPIKIDEFSWQTGKDEIKDVSKLGASTMFLQLMSALILISFTISIGIVYYGDSTATLNFTSAFQGYFSLFILFILPINGTAQSTSVLVQYNYHRNRVDKAKKARNIGFGITIGYSIFVMLLVIFVPNITMIFGQPSIGNFYPQRMAQIMFITFVFATFTLMNAIFLQSVDERGKSMGLLLTKSLMIFPIALLIGLTTKNFTPSGTNWPWASSEITPGNEYSIYLFYTVPIIDLLVFPFVIHQFMQGNKKLNNRAQKIDETNSTSNVESVKEENTEIEKSNEIEVFLN